MVQPWDCLIGAENQKQQVFKASTNQEYLQFKQVEIDTAEIIDQAIQCVIQQANATSERGRQGRLGGKSS